ncbi:MAG: hypothetical protein ACJ72R_00070 [Nitrososphaeraceae archaeon]
MHDKLDIPLVVVATLAILLVSSTVVVMISQAHVRGPCGNNPNCPP